MKLVLSGLETPIEIAPGYATTLQVENQTLFTRIARSLECADGRFALEPFTIWEKEKELRPASSLLLVSDVLHLPWDDRALMGEVVKRLECEFLEDEDMRRAVEAMDSSLSTKLLELGFAMNSDYGFGLEWDLKRYLKFRGFGIDSTDAAPLLDNVINFLSLALDAGCRKVIAFVNLKTFLTINDLKALFDFIFYSNLNVLLLESKRDEMVYDYERKITVDLHFLEY
ncbi:type II-A CRISPR-associated protein Csn2 [uncultured Senegalimassilia sp.]|uniref:type II-A CRISPR-associated protein Csn2 n=1 Tax=uncultured Senegalimassilia sp. TaxID=1714350 RepID=UPI0026E03E52|nr:type II-A CRISPR-associated protein Csn2 [uncultured Senegalimassilia sp.]